jgi:hypothetical protein
MQVDGEDAVPSYMPTQKQLHAITAPGYRSPRGIKQECVGRLIFDLDRQVEWPTFYNINSHEFFTRSFSPRVGGGVGMRFGSTKIAVMGSVGETTKERILEATPAGLNRSLEESLKEERSYLKELKAEYSEGNEKQARKIRIIEERIYGWERQIKERKEEYETYDLDLPNSEGYSSTTYEVVETNRYSVLLVYLTRGDHIYVFESAVKMHTPSDREAHKKDFAAMLAKFRPRALYEIPSEPGVCIPYGFIPDDGRTVVEFSQSLRFTDAPGVVYKIETGTVHPRRLKTPMLTAAAHAAVNAPPPDPEDDFKARVTQRVGIGKVDMGGVSGWQGGVVLKVDRRGQESHDIYSVYTGYGGWLGTWVLPYILVEMTSHTKVQAPELAQNPPPFRQSKDRLDLMLKSMRWRPTTPPMSEFESK